ncbi:hypothetical protein [Streptomyces sp. NPDC088707]|uniref:hypothetical protein n=1 Tax=Streptomyces sp. NPDC088707 TaxID=3365871 RepID=UPI00381ACF7E
MDHPEILNTDRKDMAPSQSDALYHFTERGMRPHTKEARERLVNIAPTYPGRARAQAKLRSILWDGKLMATYQHGVQDGNGQRCACFTEATDADLAYLMGPRRDYQPYAVVVSRSAVLCRGGGSVMYVLEEGDAHLGLRQQRLGHLAVPTNGGNDWTWEREWRMPAFRTSEWVGISTVVKAIVIGDASWRPVNKEGELPQLWLKSPIWVWDAATKTLDRSNTAGAWL